MRVLVIEDDEEMAEAIAFGLRQTGMAEMWRSTARRDCSARSSTTTT